MLVIMMDRATDFKAASGHSQLKHFLPMINTQDKTRHKLSLVFVVFYNWVIFPTARGHYINRTHFLLNPVNTRRTLTLSGGTACTGLPGRSLNDRYDAVLEMEAICGGLASLYCDLSHSSIIGGH